MGLLLALLATTASADARDNFRIPDARPTSIRAVDEAMRGEDEKTAIPAYLEGAQCGGWDRELDVDGFIAEVHDLPGRPHDWDGDIPSGMATREDANRNDNPDDDYDYPDSAQGLMTACWTGIDRVWREVWRPIAQWEEFDGWIEIEYGPQMAEFAHPYFEDPPCQWRIKGGGGPPIPLNEGEIFEYDKDSWEFEDDESCNDFCSYLNSFTYADCLEVRPEEIELFDGFDEDGNMLTRFETIDVCAREGLRYVCTEEEVHEDVWNQACFVPHPDIEEWANSRMCVGDQCRCPNTQDQAQCLRSPRFDEQYLSYYRLYPDADYDRDRLDQHAPNDVASKEFQSTCFGFYDEYDPKTHRTEDKDRRCVINIDVQDMRETQLGTGEYKENGVVDKDPTDPANQRPGGENDEPGGYDAEEDTWYKKLGGAFSFVNEKLFKSRYDGDLSNVFLAFDELDNAEAEATPQISPDQLIAESNLMRAFDDTGNPRAYTRWWQEQETRMAALMRPPVLRIVLPSAWFVGLDPNDPFLSEAGGTEAATSRANRSDRIELQIEADEDILGTALAYLERSLLLHIEEEPIHVLVPMGSPAEYRARAADWCNWYKSQNATTTCDDAPQDVKDVMERLEEYARRIDEYRELRAELAETTGAVLDLQRRLLEPIAGWFKDNEQRLRDIVNGRRRVEQDLVPIWQNAQKSIAKLHEQSNLPWCMNQRFTAPIYSQLDPWLPSREGRNAPVNELGLPVLPLVERPEDVIIDFSAVTAMSGTLKIPVLKPVQVRIDIPAPPKPGELAELPPVGDIRAAMDDVMGKLPEVRDELEDPPLMEPPPPLDEVILSDAADALFRIEETANRMNERYETFWKSIGPLKPGEEQFDRQIELKTEMKCEDWNTLPCDHPEMQLWEIAGRIGSHPLVFLKQHFESIGTPRTEPTNCLPDDDACHILNAERTDPGFRWEVRGSRANDAPIDALKTRVLELTQPPPLGTLDPMILRPYENDPAPLQSFPHIDITP